MSMQICPFCREKIQRQALVCRYCRRDLPSVSKPAKKSSGLLGTLTAVAIIVTGSAILAAEFFKERRRW